MLPKKALVVLADESYYEHELQETLTNLKKHGFTSTITADRKGKLHSRDNRTGKIGDQHVWIPLADIQPEQYFSIVLMTGDSTEQFKGNTAAAEQLRALLRNTLDMHGSIVGIGQAQAIVADQSINGPVHYQDCDGLWIGDPQWSPGTIIKVPESKYISKMAWKLKVCFEDASKKIGK